MAKVAKRYKLVRRVRRSDDRRRFWKIKFDRKMARLTCNCPAWIFQRGERHACKHILGYLNG